MKLNVYEFTNLFLGYTDRCSYVKTILKITLKKSVNVIVIHLMKRRTHLQPAFILSLLFFITYYLVVRGSYYGFKGQTFWLEV